MLSRTTILAAVLVMAGLLARPPLGAQAPALDAALPPPVFHHLHVNSTDPDAAIAAYLKLWPATTKKTTVAGFDALENGRIYLLFNKVASPPPTLPQSAYRHQVWLTPDVRAYVARARANGMMPEPLYTAEDGATVDISSETFPGTLTKAGLAEARQKGITPTRQAGYTYIRGPQGLVVEGFERAGETERLGQIDMWQDDPVCAELWYAAHLGATRRAAANGPAPTEATCKVAPGEPTWPSTMREGTRRTPAGRAAYGDVALFWYTKPGAQPLVSTQGQAVDHLAFAVTDLDAWVAKFRRENVRILRPSYTFGSSRAVLIEGPSREAIEVLEQPSR
jgi:catechol 2,3-dioxygenase-like lactoylglutathione lyase family enzyme